MKTSEEIMEILEAYDLTGGLRAAAALAGCDHKAVAQYVALRDAGHTPGGRPRRATTLDELLPKIEEWVVRSRGAIRADVVHQKLAAMGSRLGAHHPPGGGRGEESLAGREPAGHRRRSRCADDQRWTSPRRAGSTRRARPRRTPKLRRCTAG